ncbi:HAD family phosphatase [Undibacterium sp.]|jgi:HAD superfamily hydrolase (TIGR01509 family)|uniref:HAD family hydrolase n=1 Tax=Undibacterium sp. TaxID=1914977 RepID=UPI002C110FAE|nr:HAD family phosphatase [Undibacterium sp.]HTD04374.1 HAD family phosphatase [Undibacterium sp.]
MSRFDLVAFDCDGVLVDSEPITIGVLADLLNELGWSISNEEAMHTFVGRSVRDEFALIEANIGRPLPPGFMADFILRRDRSLTENIQPIAGIGDAVQLLHSRQMPFCVASGADRAKMHITLGRTGLLPHFEGKMFSGMEVARTKPAPDVYLLAAQTMGVAPARCVVIEDTPTGVAAGVAAGMTVYGYAGIADPRLLLAAGATCVFSDMQALPGLVL